jgi:drug/metabolite transporter (DMT)-like permease
MLMKIEKKLQISMWLSLAYFLGSAICWASYYIIGTKLDAQGVLQEPFALIPMGFLLFLAGMFVGIAHIIIRIKQARKTKKQA